MSKPVLAVRDLVKVYRNKSKPDALPAGVRGVSLTVNQGEVVGLIGESGCGKTTLGRCVARLLDPDAGVIEVKGRNFGAMRGKELRHYRKHVQVVFQRPETCLNPRMSVYQFVAEALRNFNTCPRGEERAWLTRYVDRVGLKADVIDRYPHELSGGEKQRIAILRALACEPSVIVLDEPTSALDVSVQAQVLRTLKALQTQVQTGFLFISHDVAVIRYMCSRVMVMYLGIIVEEGPTEKVFNAPQHPYTQALLAAAPRLRPRSEESLSLHGDLVIAAVPPAACPLLPRCPLAYERCHQHPPMFDVGNDQRAACWKLA